MGLEREEAVKIKGISMLATVATTALLTGCWSDDNDAPKYSKEYGLPVNCRAYVQFSIDAYRAGKYSADDTMVGLERNCGANGLSWSNNRSR